jgi:hypothetical protein
MDTGIRQHDNFIGVFETIVLSEELSFIENTSLPKQGLLKE